MENVCDVLAGADYLQMTDVRKFCFEYLASVLAHDNCFAIRVLADRFLNCEMKQKVDEFIQDNFENTILEEDFKLLSKEQLTYFLLPENRKRSVKEETIYRAVTEWLRYDMKERSCHFDELMRFVKFNELSSSFFLD
uniref:BACK domain-containing protein n=1 Tax=Ciona savignyi TaxID=51511 RepID=H2ZKJ7_CIOSA